MFTSSCSNFIPRDPTKDTSPYPRLIRNVYTTDSATPRRRPDRAAIIDVGSGTERPPPPDDERARYPALAATHFTPTEEARALAFATAECRRNYKGRRLTAHDVADLACGIGAQFFYHHRYDGFEADLFVLALMAAMRHEDELP